MFLQVAVCQQRGAWSQGGCLVLGGVPGLGGGGCMVPGGCVPGPVGVGIPACTEAYPPGEMATAADGTHPSGMHSCLANFLPKNCM